MGKSFSRMPRKFSAADIYIKNEERITNPARKPRCVRRNASTRAKLCKSAREKFLMKICNLGFPHGVPAHSWKLRSRDIMTKMLIK